MQRSYNVVCPKAAPPTCVIPIPLKAHFSILKRAWCLEAAEQKIIKPKEIKKQIFTEWWLCERHYSRAYACYKDIKIQLLFSRGTYTLSEKTGIVTCSQTEWKCKDKPKTKEICRSKKTSSYKHTQRQIHSTVIQGKKILIS